MADGLRQLPATASAATLCYVILYVSFSVNTHMQFLFSATEYRVSSSCLRNILRNASCDVPVRLAVRRQRAINMTAAGNITVAYVEDDPTKDYLLFTVNDYLLSPVEHKRAVVW